MKRTLSNAVTARNQLPSGPSLIVADETGPAMPRRQRVIVPQQLVEEHLQLTNEGKVNSKNAWDVKLIEGMQDSVTSVWEQRSREDQYNQFAKAANVIEGGAKVWTHRVESTYALTNQVIRRMMRNDGKADEEKEEGEDGENPTQTQNTQRRKKKALEKTIADSAEEINVPAHTRVQDRSLTVDPLFRAMTEKFDQSHAQGLLMNNTPLGNMGNLVLDSDYSSERGITVDELVQVQKIELSPQRASTGRTSGVMHVGAVHEPSVGALDSPSARNVSRMASEANSMMAADEGGPEDFDNGSFGGGGGYSDGEDGGAPRPLSGRPSLERTHELANAMLEGRLDLRNLDERLGLAITNDDHSEWIPMARQGPRGVLETAPMVGKIKQQCSLKAQLKAADAAANPDPDPKRRKIDRAVKFSDDLAACDDAMLEEGLKQCKNEWTCISALGKAWLHPKKAHVDGTMYTKAGYCRARATEHNIVLAPNSDLHPEWIPANMSDCSMFFQPVSTKSTQWNLLHKSTHQLRPGVATTVRVGEDGDANEEIVGDLPMDVFNDGPEGGSDDEFPQFAFANGGGTDLPDLHIDGEEAHEDEGDYIPPASIGPDVVKAIMVQHATAPTQVDVGKLRRVMWEHMQKATEHQPPRRPSPPAGEEVDSSSEEEEGAETTKFTDVISSMLPEVPRIAKDGQLSPAFFFFSMLFLANEHSIVLEGMDDLSDVKVRSIKA